VAPSREFFSTDRQSVNLAVKSAQPDIRQSAFRNMFKWRKNGLTPGIFSSRKPNINKL